MPIGTAFHARTLPLCESLSFRDWSGYYAASVYETHHEHEYNAIRNGAALIDISPLFKYRVTGPDAARFVDRLITRDVARMAVGQVYYTPWCDERGKVLDDGTVARLDEQTFRWTAADSNLRWFHLNARGLRVSITDESESTAALAVQGPAAARVLRAVAAADVDALRYFRVTTGHIAGVPVEVTRTGYTGDLGYEIWIPAENALPVWDALMATRSVTPTGMLALDVARVEAGLLLIDVDFVGSRKAMTAAQYVTPYELGLGRLVQFDKGPFIGRAELERASAEGARRTIVGLDVDWSVVERLYERHGLPPLAPVTASRLAVPVRRHGRQVGRATTTAWSPALKRLIALATIDAPHCGSGTELQFEVTVEGVRHFATARVVPTPFFNPPRKTQTPPE